MTTSYSYFKVGDKLLVMSRPYRGLIGEVHGVLSDTMYNEPVYEVFLNKPTTVSLPMAGGELITFEDHSMILVHHSETKPLTELGKAIYEEEGCTSK